MIRITHLCLVFILIIITSCNFLPPEGKLNNHKSEVFLIKKDLIVESGDTLIIEPGANYIFTDTFKIIVRGRLIVKGEQNNPVVFRPLDSITGSGNIVFEKPHAASCIDYAVFQNVRIFGKKADLSIIGCEFYNTLQLNSFDALVRVFGGSIRIIDCLVIGNNSGEGFLIHGISDGQALIENCVFDGVPDAVEFLAVKKHGRILNNKFYNIEQVGGDGIDFNGCDSVIIEGNIFTNILDYGCEIGNDTYGPSKNIFIRNNVFANCYRGIVVKGGSEVYASKNVFYKNNIGVKCQVETWSKVTDPNYLKVENSIFNLSLESDYLNNENSTLVISNCCSDKILEGKSNIKGQAQFIDPDNHNFTLTKDSDCK